MRLIDAVPRRPVRTAPADEGRWAYRPDIDGLRAVAILLVVTYHVWVGRVSGGVDVFLMLSAFFLTRGFLRRMGGPAPARPLAHLLRVFRRLVPAAAVTLLGILALVWTFFPASTWRSTWEQTWASLLYAQNALLAADAVDYYTRFETPSPLQHFWSLSVQGQAFVLWVLLLAACHMVVRRRGWAPDRVVATVFGTVFVLSLVYSVVRTSVAQQSAYFDTGARLWEFAAGSLLVVVLPRLRLAPVVRAVLGWTGLVGLLVVGLVLDVQGGFPGYLALWPVLCAAAVVVSGGGGDRHGPARLLASRPLRWVGRDAYALYLVHWPILITFLVATGNEGAGLVGGALVVVLSLASARLLTAAVDAPVRAWRATDPSPLVPVAVLVVSTATVVLPVTAWQVSSELEARAVAARVAATNPGAAVLRDPALSEPPGEVALLPLPTALEDEWMQLERRCAGERVPEDAILTGSCWESPHAARARQTVVVVGDSHAQQMTAALLPVAEDNGWGVIMLVKGGCSMGLDEPGMDDQCDDWREAAISHLERTRPDAVLTVVTRSDGGELDEAVRPGIDRFLDRMGAAGIDVVGVRDNPRFPFDMYSCVAAATDPSECAMPRAASLAEDNPATVLEGGGVQLVDLTPWICPDDVCLGVVGNVALYKDDNHLSRTYAATLAPSLAEQLPFGQE